MIVLFGHIHNSCKFKVVYHIYMTMSTSKMLTHSEDSLTNSGGGSDPDCHTFVSSKFSYKVVVMLQQNCKHLSAMMMVQIMILIKVMVIY